MPKSKQFAALSGLGGQTVGQSQGTTQLLFHTEDDEFEVNAYVVPHITGNLPMQPYPPVPEFKSLGLADSSYNNPSRIDVLSGADIYYSLVSDGRISSTSGLTAFKTRLRWAVGGPIHAQSYSTFIKPVVINLDGALAKFWELEEIPVRGPVPFSSENEEVERHFASTHSRDSTGRFVVQLPMKEPMQPLGSSRNIAVKRLEAIERRLARNDDYRKEYNRFMADYEGLGHMKLIGDSEINSSNMTCYIPHHFVLKLSSTTTKFRVVFDASAYTSNGNSLNNSMMVGPTIQPPLTTIIMRFRKHPIAFSADITKIYRQIKVARENQDLQRIVWRPHPSEPIRDYRLTTVTYGTAAAPYQATKVLQTLAEYESNKYPLAAEIAINDFYVDDCMSGANTVDEAIELYNQLTGLMASGGMELRKWSSNSPELLDHIPDVQRELETLIELDDPAVKMLGISWNTQRDCFQFLVSDLSRSGATPLTRRNRLSDIAKLFDPLGWFAPVTISAKIMMQELWKANLDWDIPVPTALADVWVKFRDSLTDLASISIPRCINSTSVHLARRLVGFCDASERAYSAVIYSVILTNDDAAVISLIAARTRVAPIKSVSLPRLELCGALLLAQLLTSVREELRMEFDESIAYTDSTIVLAWIKTSPHLWNTFVANRVSKIQALMNSNSWRHVPGIENPADCASRGIMPDQLQHHPLWWKGPGWLGEVDLPYQSVVIPYHDHEIKQVKAVTFTNTIGNSEDVDLLHKYSSLRKLIAVTAWMKRFGKNCSSSVNERERGPLSPQELNDALMIWIHRAQNDVYQREIKALTSHKMLSPKSHILKLNPFVDSSGTLRVGGRLRNASQLSPDRKRPILLPQQHKLTELLNLIWITCMLVLNCCNQ